MEGCHGSSSAQTRAAGASCSADNQCASGSCRDFACVGDGGNNNGAPRFFVRLGAGASVSYAQQGMRTDRQPCAPNTDTDCTPVEGWRDPQSVADGNANGVPDDVDTTRSYGYDPGPRFSPGDWSQRTPCTSENGYCFYVETAGMVPNWMLRADVGYYVLDWLAIAAELRFQPNSGNTTSNGPSFMLAGLRAEFQLTPPVTSGFHAHAHVGLTFGQVQVFLSRGERSRYAPWAVSGPVGANVGATLGYRFVRNFGIYAQPIVMLQFPDFLFNLDIAGGVEFGF